MEQFVNRFVKILYILIINDLSDKFYYLREHKGGSIPPFLVSKTASDPPQRPFWITGSDRISEEQFVKEFAKQGSLVKQGSPRNSL